MNVFVTGGSGFVGRHLIGGLVAAGHTVHAMARSTSSSEVVRALGARPVRCDLDDVAAAHLQGIDVVIHAAAHVAEFASWDTFWAWNVGGTERVLTAARDAGVARFLLVGTEAAVFDGDDLVDVDESAPYTRHRRFPYGATKAEAERRVIAANRPGFTTLSIRPRLVWGPDDTSVLPTILDAAANGRFAWIGGGGARTSTTHVANLVHALILALDHGRGGEVYFVADDGTRTYRTFLSALAATRGVTLPERTVPSWVARPLSRVVEGLWHALRLRSTPPMTAMPVHMLSSTVTLRTDKARKELGWAPVMTVERGLSELSPPARTAGTGTGG